MSRGFTLVEMLLSVALLSLIAGISIPVYQQFQVRNNVDITASNVVESLRRASILAQGGYEDSTWSVNISTSSIILYKGSTFATRDTTYDEVIAITPDVIPSGMSDVTFARLTGFPSTTLTPIVLTSSSNETRTITLNAKGTITY